MSWQKRLKEYYRLTKPGIIYGNLIYALAGFLLAAAGHIDVVLLGAVLVGMALVMAAGCVFNNYIDRGIDARMQRTKQRPLLTGTISGRSALVFGTALTVVGFVILAIGTNHVVVMLGVAALFSYVVLYGIAKRRTAHGTLVGTIPGALPPVAGYAAVTAQLDAGAWILFLILVLWQLPHFYGIAMYRAKEYAAAHLPVMPLVYGMRATRWQIIGYMVLFTLAAPLLSVYDYAGISYAVIVALLGMWWLAGALRTYHAKADAAWGRGIFFASLKVTIGLALALALGPLLP